MCFVLYVCVLQWVGFLVTVVTSIAVDLCKVDFFHSIIHLSRSNIPRDCILSHSAVICMSVFDLCVLLPNTVEEK